MTMKQANFSLTFRDMADSKNEHGVAIEFLPCQFQKNLDDCNKDIYFDPIIRPVEKDGLQCKIEGFCVIEV